MPASAQTALLRLSACTVDLDRGLVLRDEGTAQLTTQERTLLRVFATSPGVSFTRDELLERVWGQDNNGQTRSVDVAIRRLRCKVEANPSSPEHLVTVRGKGYRYLGESLVSADAPSPRCWSA